jgi:predicted amidohydrolase
MTAKSFKLALIQMCVHGGRRDLNLQSAKLNIAAAAREGAKVILLPEAMDLGWTHPSALKDALPIPEGESSRFLSAEAKRYQLYICAGLIEKDGEYIYNSAILINPQGEIILKHRKINELDIGRLYYKTGDDQAVCETDYGSMGLIICADAKEHRLLQNPGEKGVRIILSPCSWAVPADHDNNKAPYGQEWIDAYGPAAKQYSMWIAGCSNVGWMHDGPWKGWKAIGCSLVIDPKGNVRANAPYGVDAESIVYIDIPLVDL